MTVGISGFAFPFQLAPAGGVKTLSDTDKLRANLAHIILTNVGERVMRRGYGGNVRSLIQDPSDSTLQALMQHQIGKTVGLLEPRVVIQQVTLSQADDGATLVVSITYIVAQTQALQTLSVPITFDGL